MVKLGALSGQKQTRPLTQSFISRRFKYYFLKTEKTAFIKIIELVKQLKDKKNCKTVAMATTVVRTSPKPYQ